MMEQQMLVMKLAKLLIICIMPIILMVSAKVSEAASCQNRVDLAIAVDTTSSLSSSSFDQVKAEVKGIVSAFKVGPDNIRLALISTSQRASVLVNFNAVNSLSDFNDAVDRLTLSTDIVDLSEGIRVAKESVFSTARTGLTSKSLILVKDRRPGSSTVSEAAVLLRVTSETAAVKALGAVVNAVGVGGLWNRLELVAIFGPDYLLFKNRSKALESVKSLNNMACTNHCANNGASDEKHGYCFHSKRHSLYAKTDLSISSSGKRVCSKEITREFSDCSGTDRCFRVSLSAKPCDVSVNTAVEQTFQLTYFHPKLQRCATSEHKFIVRCSIAQDCSDQVADVYLLVDISEHVNQQNVARWNQAKAAMVALVNAMSIGRDATRVGLYIFGLLPKLLIKLESLGVSAVKGEVVRQIRDMPLSSLSRFDTVANVPWSLLDACTVLKTTGRSNAAKFIFFFQEASNVNPLETLKQSHSCNSAGISIIPFGIGSKVSASELKRLVQPDTDTSKILFNDYSELTAWIQSSLAPRMCAILKGVHYQLCVDHVVLRTVTDCVQNVQVMNTVAFKINRNVCQKHFTSTLSDQCRSECNDILDGASHYQRYMYTRLCYSFDCNSVPRPSISNSECLAADGSCKAVGSSSFRCYDENGKEFSDCRCVMKNGKVTLMLED